MTTFRRVASALACGVMLVACENQSTDPASLSLSGPGLQASAVKFWEAGASVHWNAIARDVVIRRGYADQIGAWRLFAYLSLAQYNAVIAAQNAADGASRPSEQAAVAGASAAVLTDFFPVEQAFLDGQVTAQRDGAHWPGEGQDFAAGETVARGVGAQVLASAATDRFNAPWTGTIPVCNGCWRSNSPSLPPIRPLLGQICVRSS